VNAHPRLRFLFCQVAWYPTPAVAPSESGTEVPPPLVPFGGVSGVVGVGVVTPPPAAPPSTGWLYRKAEW
jgi:hypothetical protein